MNPIAKRAAAFALALIFALPLAACAGTDNTDQTPPATPTVEPTPTPTPDPELAVQSYWSEDQLTQAWGPNQVVEHLFFHPVIAYPQWAFHDCSATKSEKEGLDDWMVTVDEYNKILQNLYEKDYILVNMCDVWSEQTDESGQTRMVRNTLMLGRHQNCRSDVKQAVHILKRDFHHRRLCHFLLLMNYVLV